MGSNPVTAFVVSLLASTIGAISGIGGGVVIKPVLDIAGFADTAVISFLSGITVLSMSAVTLMRSVFQKPRIQISFKTSLFIAIGSVIGGIGGKLIFNRLFGVIDKNAVSAVQSLLLFLMIVGVIIYLINKRRIKTRSTNSAATCIAVGLALGASSSFLGIGGGPINIIMLYYFFSMNPKTAALNSIFIILFSQISSLIYQLLGNTVPDFDPLSLIVMIGGGVGGALIGRALSAKMSQSMVERLYACLMVFVAGVCIVNLINTGFLNGLV